jgi:hypothetical protein
MIIKLRTPRRFGLLALRETVILAPRWPTVSPFLGLSVEERVFLREGQERYV